MCSVHSSGRPRHWNGAPELVEQPGLHILGGRYLVVEQFTNEPFVAKRFMFERAAAHADCDWPEYGREKYFQRDNCIDRYSGSYRRFRAGPDRQLLDRLIVFYPYRCG